MFDTKLYENPTYDENNFGNNTTIALDNNSIGSDRIGLWMCDHWDTVGTEKTINYATLYMYFDAVNMTDSIDLRLMLKPWGEGNGDNIPVVGAADDNCWEHPDSSWTLNCAQSADDAGAFNRLDGSGPDRRATPFASFLVTSGVTGWYSVVIPGSICNSWYNGSLTNYGVHIWRRTTTGAASVCTIRASEWADSATTPYIVIDYNASGEPPTTNRRRTIQMMDN